MSYYDLSDAIAESDMRKFKRFLQAGSSLQADSGTSILMTILNYAKTENLKVSFFQCCLDSGRINFKLASHQMALFSVLSYDAQLLNMCLKAGADPNTKDYSRYGTLLNYAVIRKTCKAHVEILLKAGAIPNQQAYYSLNNRQFTDLPLHSAIYNYEGDLGVIKCLIEHKADINALNPNNDHTGYTPLMLAAELKQLNVVKYLVEQGADILLRSPEVNNLSALDIAKANHQKEIAKYLEKVLQMREEALQLLTMGVNAYQAQDHKNAISICQQATLLNPSYANPHLLLALIYFQIDELGEAMQHLNAYQASKPNNQVKDIVNLYHSRLTQKTARLNNKKTSSSENNESLFDYIKTDDFCESVINDAIIGRTAIIDTPALIGFHPQGKMNDIKKLILKTIIKAVIKKNEALIGPLNRMNLATLQYQLSKAIQAFLSRKKDSKHISFKAVASIKITALIRVEREAKKQGRKVDDDDYIKEILEPNAAILMVLKKALSLAPTVSEKPTLAEPDENAPLLSQSEINDKVNILLSLVNRELKDYLTIPLKPLELTQNVHVEPEKTLAQQKEAILPTAVLANPTPSNKNAVQATETSAQTISIQNPIITKEAGLTALLMHALSTGDIKPLQALLSSQKINLNAKLGKNETDKSIEDYTPLQLVLTRCNLRYPYLSAHNNLVQLLLDHGAEVNANVSVMHADYVIANDLLCDRDNAFQKASLFAPNNTQSGPSNIHTSLSLAILYSHADVIISLINYGANVNAIIGITQNIKLPLLHFVAGLQQEKVTVKLDYIMRILIEHGANLGTKVGNLTPLHLAANIGSESRVRLLLENFADLEAKTDKGLTAAMLAENKNHYPILQLLEEYDVRFKQLGQQKREHYQRAEQLFNANNYADAITILNNALSIDKHYADAYFLRARAKVGIADYEGAVADNSQVIRLEPNNAFAFSNRALAKRELGQLGEALTDYAKAIELNATDAFTFNGRGLTHRKMNNLDSAIDDYSRAIQINPHYVEAIINRVYCFSAQEKFAEAMQDCTSVLQNNSKHTTALILRGLAKEGLKNELGAIDDYQKAAALNDTYAMEQVTRLKTHLKEQEELKRRQAEEERLQFAARERERLEAESKAKAQKQEQAQSENFTQALADLKLTCQNNSQDARAINQAFKQLEKDALRLENADFFLLRAKFFDSSAQRESTATRKKLFEDNAIKDYQQALRFDSFIEDAAERIEAIQEERQSKFGATANRLFTPSPVAPTILPSRDNMTPEQLARLEAMKEQKRMMNVPKNN